MAAAEGLRRLRRRLWRLVGELPDGELPRTGFNRFFAFLIVFSVVFAVVATEGSPNPALLSQLRRIDLSISLVFLAEYLLRLWVSPLSQRYGRGWRAYGRYLRSPFALVDLVALLPLFVDVLGSELHLVRLFRLLRVLRLSRSRRFREAVFRFGYALRAKRSELEVALVFTGSVILVSATGLYLSEGNVQPEHFGSIPRALWWAVCTVTTVGYGDVVPITVVGRVLGGLTALAGIGSIAIPTGILVVGFGEAAEALKRRRPGNHAKRRRSRRARRSGQT
ncbi:MAG: potassium channel family protein [Cyanobium sp. M30B3]|nr:MAG: potassium channel family protein [Cyanobium sp. M30B3]